MHYGMCGMQCFWNQCFSKPEDNLSVWMARPLSLKEKKYFS